MIIWIKPVRLDDKIDKVRGQPEPDIRSSFELEAQILRARSKSNKTTRRPTNPYPHVLKISAVYITHCIALWRRNF